MIPRKSKGRYNVDKPVPQGHRNDRRTKVLLLCIVISLIIGIMDYLTGDYAITVIYIIPVYLAGKLHSSSGCVWITLLCVAELLISAVLCHPHTSISGNIFLWNTILQALMLAVTGYLVSKITTTV
jgi:hypothetical protein